MTDPRNNQRRDLYIARAEEAAKNYGLILDYNIKGPWVIFYANQVEEMNIIYAFEVKARGWKNASDAFIKEATEWMMSRGKTE